MSHNPAEIQHIASDKFIILFFKASMFLFTKKWDGMAWPGLIWLRIGTGSGLL
jgi:hypothetical protein